MSILSYVIVTKGLDTALSEHDKKEPWVKRELGHTKEDDRGSELNYDIL
jgi:hypothetical protein